MLKQRVLTAAILIPLLLVSIIWLPGQYFALLIAFVATVGAWEWTKIMQLTALQKKFLYMAIFVVALTICWFVTSLYPESASFMLYGSLLWWICALLLIVSYPRRNELCGNIIISGLIGIVILVPCWLSITLLHNKYEQGIQLVVYLFALIAVADSGAYFGGRFWGRNKLAPSVSPGKSWEGVISGLVCVGVLAYFCVEIVMQRPPDWQSTGVFIVISLVTAAFSIVGDLTESMFKRRVGLKDSGSILPGHGGVLDRIDSMTAAAPLFAICLHWFFEPDNYLLPLQHSH